MYFKLKKSSLVILAVTATVCSRVMFALFDDPGGPNLLIVTVMALIVYCLSLVTNRHCPLVKEDGPKKIISLVLVQIIIVAVFYLFLK